jgi:hypothetical protein
MDGRLTVYLEALQVLLPTQGNVMVVRFEVFSAVTMKNGVFWDVTPCGSVTSQKTPFFIVTAVKTSNLTT